MGERRELQIGKRTIGEEHPCYVIAEVGHNHQGSVDQCKELFQLAKWAGASAVKLQKRDNRSLFTRAMFDSPYESRNSFGPTYGQHREALELGRDEYLELKAFAESLGLDFFATAFDIPSADFLEEIGVPAYKLASGDLLSTPLLEHVARKGKPMIVSTGGAEMADVVRAYEAIMPINPQLCILQCTAAYPAQPEQMNLGVITSYRERFPDIPIGLSDHQSGISMALVAYMLGARVVEKHFTLNRAMKGTDHAFSLEPIGLRKLCRDLERARVAIGDGIKRRLPEEEKPLFKMGKKLVAARDLPAGHVLTRDDVTMKSPNDGLAPFHLGRLLGKTLARDLAADETLLDEAFAG